jgi:1-deoxy-D-xylulose-5-phosphate reductoisomerase
VLNAANEVAVDAFLAGEIAFTDIAGVNEDALQALGAADAPADVGAVLALDAQARRRASARLARCTA